MKTCILFRFPFSAPMLLACAVVALTGASSEARNVSSQSSNGIPEITCPPDVMVNAPPGATSTIVDFPAATVCEDCGEITIWYSPESGSVFNIGTTTVIATASDTEGNTNTCSFTVTVNAASGEAFVAEFVTAPMVLNRQTSLFEQWIRLRNDGETAVEAARVYVMGLPATNSLYNAQGWATPADETNAAPFVVHNEPLPPGSNVLFLLEFHLPNRIAVTNHTLLVEEVSAALPPFLPAGAQPVPLQPGREPLQVASGRFLVEWSSIPGRTYAVQYSSDLETWRTVSPFILAPNTRVQWLDDGPPKTESKPAGAGSRFYRVFLLPAD
jgi:hypothetical protein